MHSTKYFRRPEHTAEVMIVQSHLHRGQVSQGLQRADQPALGVGVAILGDEHGAGRSGEPFPSALPRRQPREILHRYRQPSGTHYKVANRDRRGGGGGGGCRFTFGG